MTLLRDLDTQLAELGERLPATVRRRQWTRSLDAEDYRPALASIRARLMPPERRSGQRTPASEPVLAQPSPRLRD